MTKIEQQILKNQAVIMDALCENMKLSTFAKRDLNDNRIDTLRLIKREQEREQDGNRNL